ARRGAGREPSGFGERRERKSAGRAAPHPSRTRAAERTAGGQTPMNVRPGLEVLLDDPHPIAGKKIGLVTNQSAVTSDLRHAVRVLQAGRGWKLTALFGPEHGIWGEAQDMDHV